MSLDLSALDIDLNAPSPTAAGGKPLELALTDVLEDPKNARKEYDPSKMAELAASIAEKGIKSPISVKTHPAIPGKYLINHGHRRYRASKEAGKTHVPAFVDELHDDFDQVVENLQREDLSPLELAMFISAKLDEGHKKGEVAQKLGKKPAMITEHLALIDPPGSILDLYRRGQLTSPRTIYDLRQLYEKFPDQVQPLVDAHVGPIERRTVEQWATALKTSTALPPADAFLRHDEKLGGENGSESMPPRVDAAPTLVTDSGQADTKSPPASNSGDSGNPTDRSSGNRSETSTGPTGANALLAHNPANEKALQKKTPGVQDPSRIKKPVLLVEFDGRAAMVLLWSRPTTPGLLRIKYEDNGDEVEVDAGLCKINCLLEATA